MNDTLFNQRLTAAFAALPPADVYLKNRLLKLPDETRKPAVARRLLPLAGALAVVVAMGIAIPLLVKRPPQPPIDLPPISLGSMYGMAGMGFEAHMNKSAAELHRASPAYGREGGIGTMAVYRNPGFGKPQRLDEAAAMEIADKFGKAMGKTYVYEPPYWLSPEGLEKTREKLGALTPEEGEQAVRQSEWSFKCGEETLSVSDYGGVRVSLYAPLPTGLPQDDSTAASYEANCRQLYGLYAAAVEALTGLRFNMASTAFDYNIYGEKHFETFLYANNPGDPLAKQAEDYALKRLTVSWLPEKDYVDYGVNSQGQTVETSGHQDAEFWLGFDLAYPGESDLLGIYPVMDLESVVAQLRAGNYEASVSATKEELARATIEEAELIYSAQPWLSTFLPMYRLYLTFPPEDLDGWNNNNPHLEELGLRNYYVFYVPAVPPEYLVPQQEDSGMPRPAG